MSNFAYIAFDARGHQTRGTLEVEGQLEAISRIKEMGFFPTKIVEVAAAEAGAVSTTKRRGAARGSLKKLVRASMHLSVFGPPVKPKQLAVFTRQLATLLEAGMPLLRGLRLLQEQERQSPLSRVTGELAEAIEGGNTLSDGLAEHPKVFNKLYVNMVKAGEIGGVLEVALKRLADFMEKAQKLKGKIIAASFYPTAVLVVAVTILLLLMGYVVPKFKEVFDGLLNGKPMPAFTLLVLNISETVKSHFVLILATLTALGISFQALVRTRLGRRRFDQLQLRLPILGPVIRKLAISRFTRTFGTLVGSGVPILQALTIVKETAGNVVLRDAVAAGHESIKECETITVPMKASAIFPPLVVGMVDVGEQTGALPEMLMKIADTYDEEVDNAATAMTSLLEPIFIVFLAVVVGSIVIALFLPLVTIVTDDMDNPNAGDPDPALQ